QLNRITVFTGSRHGNSDAYVQAVESFAHALADHGYGLVFGGGDVGLMGVLADTVLAAGGEVTGIMPDALRTAEIPHPNLTTLEIVPNMHIRKERMAALGDAFV